MFGFSRKTSSSSKSAGTFAKSVMPIRFCVNVVGSDYFGLVTYFQPNGDSINLFELWTPVSEFNGDVEDFLVHLQNSYTTQNILMH